MNEGGFSQMGLCHACWDVSNFLKQGKSIGELPTVLICILWHHVDEEKGQLPQSEQNPTGEQIELILLN